jgi:hypothetical protein
MRSLPLVIFTTTLSGETLKVQAGAMPVRASRIVIGCAPQARGGLALLGRGIAGLDTSVSRVLAVAAEQLADAEDEEQGHHEHDTATDPVDALRQPSPRMPDRAHCATVTRHSTRFAVQRRAFDNGRDE